MATKKATEEKNEAINPVEVASLNIYQKMQLITQEISAVAKNLNVGFGQSQYKATGEADVLAAVKPIEAKYGVYSYPFSRSIVDAGTLENIKKMALLQSHSFLELKQYIVL